MDEDLISLREEIKKNMTDNNNEKHPKYAQRQSIQGNGNYQVAGNLEINSRKKVNQNSPDAIGCPQCKELAYRRSDWCKECNFNLREYFNNLDVTRKKSSLSKVIFSCLIIGFAIIYITTHFFKESEFHIHLMVVGLAFLGIAAIAGKEIEKL